MVKKTGRGATPADRVRTGILRVHPDGFAFFSSDDDELDVYVAARARGGAIDRDTVEVEWSAGPRGLDGRVVRIVQRGRDRVTGEVHGRGRGARLVLDDPRLVHPVVVQGDWNGASDGVAVLATITRYPENDQQPLEVQIAKVLGDPEDPRTEIEKILAGANVADEFEPIVARMAAGMPTQVNESDLADRADLRHLPFCTIDPETARDFDDAVALEDLPRGGHRLWVAVADVSHYVREDSPIDREAQKRGVSLYLPNRAIPMLPEQLSAHICSLVPKEDRLAMVARIDFDARAEAVATDFCAAVIHSRGRLDYPGVAAALQGKLSGKHQHYAPFLPDLKKMQDLAEKLRERRMARGALNLDLPEAVIDLDQDDPKRIRDVRRSRKDPGERGAYGMIEEFMLAANEAVARSFDVNKEDAIWRVHDSPARPKLEAFSELAMRYGIDVDVDEVATPRGLRTLLRDLEGNPAERPLSFQLLRSLKQATYDVVNVGHFGLAAPHYVHFTSPIRRYPDLIVHRLLKGRLASQKKPAGGFPSKLKVAPPPTNQLAAMASASSKAERRAQEIEREAVDVYRTYFMRDRVGDEATGLVTGVTAFGMFVTLDEPFVEGLIRIEDLPRDQYRFDEQGMRLLGRGGAIYCLGDVVKVQVIGVSVPRRKIDLRPAGMPATATTVSGGRYRRTPDAKRGRAERTRDNRRHTPEGASPPAGRGGEHARDGRHPPRRKHDATKGRPTNGAGRAHPDGAGKRSHGPGKRRSGPRKKRR